MDGINKMFNDQEYEDSVSMFRDDLDDATEETENSDIDSYLKSIGISGSIGFDDDDEDEDEDEGDFTPTR
jgi:hypothetical protein